MENKKNHNDPFGMPLQEKPPAYLLFILPIVIGGGFGLICALCCIYANVKGIPRSAVPDRNMMLIVLPALFLWIPAGLLLSNLAMYCLPPVRRIAERYVEATGRPGFAQSQKLLLKVFGVFAIVCVPLIVLGFIL